MAADAPLSFSSSAHANVPLTPALQPPASVRRSGLEAALDRCAALGVRFILTLPADARMSAVGATRFPARTSDPRAAVEWDTAYRVFCARSRQPHDRGSWRILAVAEERVVGAITARFFGADVVRDYVHTLTLLEPCGPVLREHCERAIAEAFTLCQRAGRTAAEISHWAVEPHRQDGASIAATLLRAMGALLAAFDAPLIVLAADHRRGEVARLMRLGAAPLGCAGKFALPPFVHHATGAWLRVLLLEAATYHQRARATPAADLARLCASVPFISAS